MATATNDIDDIRRKMARIRREIHEDVKGMVESAEAVTDWKHYVRTYPWLAIGLAAAVGFVIVPRKKRTRGITVAETAKVVRAEIANAVGTDPAGVAASLAPAPAPALAPKPKGKGLLGSVFSMIAPVALRAAQGYATQFLGNWIAQQQGAMAEQMAAAGLGPMAGMGPQPGMGPRPGPGMAPGMGPSPSPRPGGPGVGMPGSPPNRGI